jgi:lipid-binding SYLF domain-containing protein
MKLNPSIKQTRIFLLSVSLLIASLGFSQSSKDSKIIADSKAAKQEFINADGLIKNLFNSAAGYVIFPNVGKGGLGVGAASGNGAVYSHGTLIGMAKLSQLTVGFQAGGQAYREVIFFENEAALNKFKENNIQLSAQASAVAVTAGASANAKYKDGVMIFTKAKGGLMYEASVGGQKFKFRGL